MLVCKKDFVLLVSQCDSVFNSYSFSQPMCTTRAAHFIPISVSGQCLPSVYEIPPYLTPTSPQRQADSSKLPIPTHVPTATHSHAIPPSSPHSLPNLSLDPVPHCTGCPSQLPGERIASLCLLYPRMCQGTVRTTNNISPPPCFLAYPDARSFIIKSFLGKNTQLRLCFASYVFLLPSGSCDTLLTALNSAQHQHRVPGNAN